MAEVVTAEEVQSYARTMSAIDRLVDERINGVPPRAVHRVITEDQWRAELGQKGPRTYRHLPAEITVRG